MAIAKRLQVAKREVVGFELGGTNRTLVLRPPSCVAGGCLDQCPRRAAGAHRRGAHGAP